MFFVHGESLLAIKLYLTMMSFLTMPSTHILFLSEEKKMPSETLQNPEQFPLVVVPLLCYSQEQQQQ